jgi:hypothetical protein
MSVPLGRTWGTAGAFRRTGRGKPSAIRATAGGNCRETEDSKKLLPRGLSDRRACRPSPHGRRLGYSTRITEQQARDAGIPALPTPHTADSSQFSEGICPDKQIHASSQRNQFPSYSQSWEANRDWSKPPGHQ